MDLLYLFLTVAFFCYMITEDDLWAWNDTGWKRLWVSALAAPLWPIWAGVTVFRKIFS